ncbi:hypothetical protein GQ457_01G054790 [Hibiscus cannabinus]
MPQLRLKGVARKIWWHGVNLPQQRLAPSQTVHQSDKRRGRYWLQISTLSQVLRIVGLRLRLNMFIVHSSPYHMHRHVRSTPFERAVEKERQSFELEDLFPSPRMETKGGAYVFV